MHGMHPVTPSTLTLLAIALLAAALLYGYYAYVYEHARGPIAVRTAQPGAMSDSPLPPLPPIRPARAAGRGPDGPSLRHRRYS